MNIDYQAVEETLRADYREVSARYRQDDEIEVATENHRRIAATLAELCDSFPHAIRALEIGCGTGRYFHCLRNVHELVGIDISEEMLQAAEHPVQEEQISAGAVRLIRTNVLTARFLPESFHLIYSLGMFGNGCAVTAELCDQFHDWLVPSGKLYFDTVDSSGLPLRCRARRRARRLVYPLLVRRWRQALDDREGRRPFFSLSRRELQEILLRSRFEQFRVASHVCQSPLWSGRHLECVAIRD